MIGRQAKRWVRDKYTTVADFERKNCLEGPLWKMSPATDDRWLAPDKTD